MITINTKPMWTGKRFVTTLFTRNLGAYVRFQQQGLSSAISRTISSGNKSSMKGRSFRYLSTTNTPRAAEPSNNQSNDKEGGKQRHWWSTSIEFKVITTLALGAISYTVTWYMDRRHAVKEGQLERVNRQIRDLYGPLYGNRLIQEKTYRAVMGEHGGLKKYLLTAQETKDAEMIRRWRSFVVNVLYPLDEQAEALISKNAHLISNSVFPEALEHFLLHFACLKFVMESWKNEDGELETAKEFTPDDYLEVNNASGEAGVKEMLHHVKAKYKELSETQRRLEVEINAQDSEHAITGTLSKLAHIR